MFNLIRREPGPLLRPLTSPFFRDMEEVNDRLGQFFATRPYPPPMATAEWLPPIDIQETETEYLFKAELPEVRKEDVKVTLQDGTLAIQGERRQEKEEKGKKYLRVEREYGSFVRTFGMPPDADEKKITADFKDGLLKIRVPKSEKPPQKSIEVKFS
jgi:HSP20 family protein